MKTDKGNIRELFIYYFLFIILRDGRSRLRRKSDEKKNGFFFHYWRKIKVILKSKFS